MADSIETRRVKTLDHISETGQLSTADLFVLRYCEKCERKKTQTPPLTQFLTGAGNVLGFVRTMFGGAE